MTLKADNLGLKPLYTKTRFSTINSLGAMPNIPQKKSYWHNKTYSLKLSSFQLKAPNFIPSYVIHKSTHCSI
jgi:hypothetical protein